MNRRPRSAVMLSGVVVALGLLLWTPASSLASRGIPAVNVNLTIAGSVVGSVAFQSPAIAAEPEEGCAALPAHGYEAKARLLLRTTFTHLLLPLVKLNAEGYPERPAARASEAGRPTGSGGSRGGSFSYSGDFPAEGESLSHCFSLQHYAANAELAPSAHSRLPPTYDTEYPDFSQFWLGGLQGGSVASPPRFAAPNGESQPVLFSLPFYLPADRLFFVKHAPAAVQVGYDEVGVNWNELQRKLGHLRQSSQITIHASGGYRRQLRVAEPTQIGEGCVETNEEPSQEPRTSTCRQSTEAHFTITVHRNRLLTVG